MHRRGRSLRGLRARMRKFERPCESTGYHSFALERAARALLMTIPWNYCGTSRPPGCDCARRGLKNVREERIGESTARRNPADHRRLSFYSGWLRPRRSSSLSPPFNHLLTVDSSTSRVLGICRFRDTFLLENALFYCYRQNQRQLPASLPSKRLREMSNAVFEFA